MHLRRFQYLTNSEKQCIDTDEKRIINLYNKNKNVPETDYGDSTVNENMADYYAIYISLRTLRRNTKHEHSRHYIKNFFINYLQIWCKNIYYKRRYDDTHATLENRAIIPLDSVIETYKEIFNCTNNFLLK
jgi:predicted metalloendopeptidase